MRIVFIAAALLSTLAHAETVERRAAADPRGEVEITNVAGEVRVEGWDRAEVQLNADLGRDVERLEFERKGTLTIIEVVLPRRGARGSASDLVVKVPRESALTVSTVSADQIISGVRGSQRRSNRRSARPKSRVIESCSWYCATPRLIVSAMRSPS